MTSELYFLLLEDNDADAELIARELRKTELKFRIERTRSREEFERALRQFPPDLVLADYSLPSFDGPAALRMVLEIRPYCPCIIVSGTVGEDVAIDTVKKGAVDYVMKTRLGRLLPAVSRALEEAARKKELHAAEERLREQATLLNHAHDAIVQVDLDGHIRFWNSGAQRLYGWSERDVLGKAIGKLIFANEADFEKGRGCALEHGDWMGEIRQKDQLGKQLTVESRWALVRDGPQQPRSILIVNTDVTEKKKIEAQLLRAQRMESIGMLAGGIAHDLNNILAPILMAAEALQRKVADPEALKLISTIESSAARGADIVKHVLMFARGVEGVHRLITPRELIGEIKKILEETFPKSIQVVAQLQPDLGALYGDMTQFQQVLLNLCVNARDAMPSGGILSIQAQNTDLGENEVPKGGSARPGPHVLIRVSDTGEGIPPQNLQKIFEPFFTTKAAGRGTGLGLSMVHSIVKSHGGFIRVESEVGKGTSFLVYLPAFENLEQREVVKTRAQAPPGHGECLLVVDDEASILEMTKEMLTTFGYQVLTAKDGAEARALFEVNKQRISAVLVDMIMPVMEGPACIEALRTIDPGVKIILTSGLDEHEKHCNNGHYCTFLAKPYTAQRLLTTVHEVIAS